MAVCSKSTERSFLYLLVLIHIKQSSRVRDARGEQEFKHALHPWKTKASVCFSSIHLHNFFLEFIRLITSIKLVFGAKICKM